MAAPTTERPRRQEQEPASAEITEMAPGILRSQLPISLPGPRPRELLLPRGRARAWPSSTPACRARSRGGRWSHRLKRGRLQAQERPHRRRHPLPPRPLRRRRAPARHLRRRGHLPPELPHLVRPRRGRGARRRARRRRRRRVHHRQPRRGAGRCPGAPTPPSSRRSAGACKFGLYRHALKRFMRTPAPTRRVDDAEVITLARREWVVPAHARATPTTTSACSTPPTGSCSPATTCCPPSPRTSPGLVAGADPLTEFFASLDKVAGLEGVTLALPAHGHPFDDLAGRAHEIRDHHAERLDTLRAAAQRARRRHRRGVQPQALPAAVVGPDGRERDLRPPRAPPRDRRGHQPRRPTAPCTTRPSSSRAAAHRVAVERRPRRRRPSPRARRSSVAVADGGHLHAGAALDGGAVLHLGPQRRPEVAASGQRLLHDLPAGRVVDVAEHVEVGEAQRPGEAAEAPSGGSGWSSRAFTRRPPDGLAVDLVEAGGDAARAARRPRRSAPRSWPPRSRRPPSPTIEMRRSAQWLPVPEHHVASAQRLEVAGERRPPRSPSCAPPRPRRRAGRRRRCRRPRGPAGTGPRRRGAAGRPG